MYAFVLKSGSTKLITWIRLQLSTAALFCKFCHLGLIEQIIDVLPSEGRALSSKAVEEPLKQPDQCVLAELRPSGNGGLCVDKAGKKLQ